MNNILLIGGSGFIGSHLAQVLDARGMRVSVPTRRRERAKHLLPLPLAEVVEADVHDPATLERLMRGRDAVINLVGVLHGGNGKPYGAGFAQAHVELPRKIVAAARSAGVGRLLHMSALHAATDAPSQYLRSKADGEAAVRAGGDTLAWTMFRPSVVFGPEDAFLNMFADLARSFPVLPLACPEARFQPVYVEDVVGVMADCLTRADSVGQAYELGGPKVYTLRQLVEYTARLVGAPRPIIGLSKSLSALQAAILELAPGELMSRDNVASMEIDSVCSGAPLPFGRSPTALESIAPTYLGGHEPRARYSPFRARARR